MQDGDGLDAEDLRDRANRLRQAMPPRAPATPPRENGRRLGTINRSETEEIRINWSEFEGHPFFSIRMWKRYDDGTWWPDKRGIAIRVRELPDLVVAISEAIELASEVADDWQRKRAVPGRQPSGCKGPIASNGPPGDKDAPY